MSDCDFVDTFPNFLSYWNSVQHKPVEDQIASWEAQYMSLWPELLAKQIEDYASQNLDWRQVAREKVFPHLSKRFPALQRSHQLLLELSEPIYTKAQQILGFDSKVTFVIYVGIGCGAGWATLFRNQPAILFGLESIAECGWDNRKAIAGLIAHECGHLFHQYWRAQSRKTFGNGPYWQLYEEGFAQYCEDIIVGSENWHQFTGDENWLDWCQAHKKWLATEFIRTVISGQDVSAFFGSWLQIDGKSETGYFLGYSVISELKKRFSLKEIALLENVETELPSVLEQMVANSNRSAY